MNFSGKTALVIALLLMAPALAFAQCFENYGGVGYTDSDCDKVIDYDSEVDANNDGVPDGNRVDNCIGARNGDCDFDKLNCDVDENGEVTDAELNAGHQMDWNSNGRGDACDDADFDGVKDYLDNCKTIPNASQDPAACTDTDHDGFEDPIDNCPETINADQQDSDNDGVGDWCDNCRTVYNPNQNEAACPENTGYTGGIPSSALPEGSVTNDPPGASGNDLGPDVYKGNGFGQGGCALAAGSMNAQPSIPVSMLFGAVLLLLLRRSSRGQRPHRSIFR